MIAPRTGHLEQPVVLPVAVPGISRFQMNVPNFAARAFVLRMDLAGYDQQAPSVTFHDARSMALLPFAEIMGRPP